MDGHRVVQLDLLPDLVSAELRAQLSLLLHILTERIKGNTTMISHESAQNFKTTHTLFGQKQQRNVDELFLIRINTQHTHNINNDANFRCRETSGSEDD